ncbi:MAG: D-2-hydroxyacid dehydrogenase [bacterium]
MKLLVLIDLKEHYLHNLSKLYDIEVVKALEFEDQKREIKDAEILITGGGGVSPQLLRLAVKLKWIQTWSAGLDAFINSEIINQLIEKDIIVSSSSGIHGEPIAEHVMGFLINYSRRLYDFYKMQESKEWKWLNTNQLSGKTIAIIGAGSIGQEIALKAKAFKMKIIAVKRDITETVDNFDEIYSNNDLLKVLPGADYVVATVPLTDETKGMFSEKEFKAMKDSAFFVNIARGEVVNEKALIKALGEKEIAGAGLDVFEKEPLDKDSQLYNLENVYITPHVSGSFPDYNKEAIKLFKENLERFIDGQKLMNLMDYNRGY